MSIDCEVDFIKFENEIIEHYNRSGKLLLEKLHLLLFDYIKKRKSF